MAKKKLSRREKRLLRKNQKIAKDQIKSARLAASVIIPDRQIRYSHQPILGKAPLSKSPDYYKDQRLTWCITEADCDGIWSWQEPRQWTGKEYSDTIKPHFTGNENNTWKQILAQTYDGQDHKRLPLNKIQLIDTLCPEAQNRWFQNDKLAIYDSSFRFRLGSSKRVWGVRLQAHYFVIWYERFHKICPID